MYSINNRVNPQNVENAFARISAIQDDIERQQHSAQNNIKQSDAVAETDRRQEKVYANTHKSYFYSGSTLVDTEPNQALLKIRYLEGASGYSGRCIHRNAGQPYPFFLGQEPDNNDQVGYYLYLVSHGRKNHVVLRTIHPNNVAGAPLPKMTETIDLTEKATTPNQRQELRNITSQINVIARSDQVHEEYRNPSEILINLVLKESSDDYKLRVTYRDVFFQDPMGDENEKAENNKILRKVSEVLSTDFRTRHPLLNDEKIIVENGFVANVVSGVGNFFSGVANRVIVTYLLELETSNQTYSHASILNQRAAVNQGDLSVVVSQSMQRIFQRYQVQIERNARKREVVLGK